MTQNELEIMLLAADVQLGDEIQFEVTFLDGRELPPIIVYKGHTSDTLFFSSYETERTSDDIKYLTGIIGLKLIKKGNNRKAI